MSKVVVYSNWCWIDQLDGRELKQDERIRVTWPDRTQTDNLAVVKQDRVEISDHGHPYSATRSEAFVSVLIRGLLVDVRIVGLEVERLP